ncbi:MAG TPA: hydrogenase maturation nickel metallochaperone HypA [Polyangiaceae bacterium]|nr:hydrogenase maturation nickel metallochaperone HypA [Polyangiaceae bacterium]
MHEVSLVHALFDQVDRALAEHPRARLREITVRIGALSGVESELFRTAFDGTRQERGYPDTELAIEHEELAYECAECGAGVLPGQELRCDACAGRAQLTRGDELVLQRLELEVRDV